MRRMHMVMASPRWWQVLAWGSLASVVLLLASLLQAVATASGDSAVQHEPTPITIGLSAAAATRPHCDATAGQSPNGVQNTWATQMQWYCTNLSP
jgi:hypothetical protein